MLLLYPLFRAIVSKLDIARNFFLASVSEWVLLPIFLGGYFVKRPLFLLSYSAVAAAFVLTGCSHNNPPVMMAPPTTPVTISQPMGQDPNGQYANGQNMAAAGQNGAYNWTEVPVNQQVQITRAVFDQGGYQLYSPQGTIVVPFANQNMYVMKFGQSQTGGMYFVNSGQFPTLYVPPGADLQNAAQPNSNWYPFPQNYAYTNPVYVGIAPSWSAFTGMGWYPGMAYYGGYYGYSPYSIIGPMVGLHFLIGGSPYYGWNSYHSYYNSHPYGYAPMRVVNRTVYNQAARNSFSSGGGFGRHTFGSAGSTFGNRSAGSSSFGGNRSTGSFGRGPSGVGSTPRPAFGSGASGGSFGRSPSGFGGSFGAGRRSFPVSAPPSPPVSSGRFGSRPSFGGGSFGGGASTPRPSFGGGSFGGGRSFGGGGFGGGSFGGGHSSFGGGRRR